MKRILTMILLSCAMFAHVNATQIPVDLSSERIKESHSDGNQPRGPICPPSASIDGYTFYINSSHPDYVLQLVDANDGETVLFETLQNPTHLGLLVLLGIYNIINVYTI